MSIALPDLPLVATVPMILPPLSSTSRMMKIGMSSKTVDMITLSTLAFWKVVPRLKKIPGVANVPIWGERLQQWHVQVDPDKLRAHGVSLNQAIEASADALEVGLLSYSKAWHPRAGGWIDTPNQRLTLQHILPIKGPDDLAQVAIKLKDGKTVRLADVGVVKEDHPPLIGDAVINDDIGLMLIVEKFPWGNTLDITREVEKAIEALKPGFPGIAFDTTIFRPATYIEMSINNLGRALLIGAGLVVVIIGAFVLEWRVALISVVAIPLSPCLCSICRASQ
jgi:Cu/Ag efflux pump CusA